MDRISCSTEAALSSDRTHGDPRTPSRPRLVVVSDEHSRFQVTPATIASWNASLWAKRDPTPSFRFVIP